MSTSDYGKETENGNKVYCMEIFYNGKVVQVEKRYSEFFDMYRKLQKIIFVKIPFPPKRMLNRDGKFLESRRRALEFYIQAVLREVQDDIPDKLLEFLNVDIAYDEPVIEDEKLDESDGGEESYHVPNTQTHQSMICFKKDIYLYSTALEKEEEKLLPSIIMKGCLDGIYRS